jgi:hypothetical protein
MYSRLGKDETVVDYLRIFPEAGVSGRIRKLYG